MKAIVGARYGPPETLVIKDVPVPSCGDKEVLVKMCAVSLNLLDWFRLRGEPRMVRAVFGLAKPKNQILGSDFAGRVVAVGKEVTQFQPGDEVFGAKLFAGAAFAECVCVGETGLAAKPAKVTFAEAAAAPVAAITALQGLRDKGHLQAGERVLIDGASGGVGTFAVLIAKALDAEVTAVCSPRNLEMVQAIGAKYAIDYTREDFTRSGKTYDLILAANARHSIFDYRRALGPRGRYVKAGGKPSMRGAVEDLVIAPLLSRKDGQQMSTFIAKFNQPDLIYLASLLESGKVIPVIDRSYPFAEAADAFRYLGEGHARGKIVLTFEP